LILATTLELTVGAAAGLCYLLGTTMLARRLIHSKPITTAATTVFSVPGVILHGLVAYWAIDTASGTNLGIHAAAVLVTWVMAAFVLLASLRLPVASLQILVLPIAIAAIATRYMGQSSFVPRPHLAPELVLHILASIIAYSILFMAACQSLILAIQERNLRSHQGIALIRLLPPLETMETLLFSMLWTGIALLSVSIVSGFAFLDDMFAQHVVHHTVLSSAAWVMYATLLIGHQAFGWRGSTAVRWTLIAFMLLVLGYFGSKFVLEIILQR
jgi:ABC-type uncharacterized transport system permease subunit